MDDRNSSGERLYRDSTGAKCNIRGMIRREPEWVAVRFDKQMDDLTTLLGLLRECEWAAEEVTGDSQSESICPMCQAWRRDGHAPDCRLVATLKEIDNG